MVASDHHIGARHKAEATAIEYLWPHSNDLEWDEYTERGLRVFVAGQGSTLTDVQGRSYLDGLAGLFLVNVGHGRTEIGAAMAEQAGRLAYTASSNSTNPATVTLAETIASITPGDLDRVFFCSGGSEAVETALKIAKQAQVLRGYPKRYKVICRRGSYHGQTFGAMSLTSSAKERYFGPFMAGVSKVPSPNHYRNDFGLEGEAGDLMCARYVEQEILALMDEVITGYGRTGAMFAAEHYGVVPDIMTMAKGISSGYAPLGAVAVRREVFEPFTKHGNAINHLLTFGGHAVAAAAASKNIEIIQRENLVARSAEIGRYLLRLADGLRRHPTVGDVRGGKGLLCAIDLVRNKETKQAWGTEHPFIKGLALRTQEQGLITRVWDVLHLAPPLVVTEHEVELAIDIVDRCLTEMEREFADDIS